MKYVVSVLCLLSLAFPAAAEDSADAVLTEVRAMGRLNGQALACSKAEMVGRIKTFMIKLAPKSRRYGDAFETATNDEFLAQTRSSQAVCPDSTVLAGQVDEAAKRLQAALNVADPK
jgi:hypothetical protein